MSDQANWCKHEVRDPDICRKCFPQTEVVSCKGFYVWVVFMALAVIAMALMAPRWVAF